MSEAKQIMQGVCLKVFKSNFAPTFLTVQDHHKVTSIAVGVPQDCALKKGLDGILVLGETFSQPRYTLDGVP